MFVPARRWESPCLGIFFPASDRGKRVGEGPFLGSAVNNRLRVCLSKVKLCNGGTPHSFRVGLSNTLNIFGLFSGRDSPIFGMEK